MLVRDMESIKKRAEVKLVIKIMMCEMKQTLDEINSRLDIAEK